MNKYNFTEEDKTSVIDFLNLVANHARFDVDTKELISYFKKLSFMQSVLLPKIEANILEVKRVVEDKERGEEVGDVSTT